MTRRVVCDASAVAALLLDSGAEGRWVTDALPGADLAAPGLFPFECANILRRHGLAGLISPDQGAQAHADLLDLAVELRPCDVLAPRARDLRANLTAYDAGYVALAELVGVSLVTLDAWIGRAPEGSVPGAGTGPVRGLIRGPRGPGAPREDGPVLTDDRLHDLAERLVAGRCAAARRSAALSPVGRAHRSHRPRPGCAGRCRPARPGHGDVTLAELTSTTPVTLDARIDRAPGVPCPVLVPHRCAGWRTPVRTGTVARAGGLLADVRADCARTGLRGAAGSRSADRGRG